MKRNTPRVRKNPVINLLEVIFKLAYLTLEKNIATNRTDNTEEDLKTITTGKLVLNAAWVYVNVETNTHNPQKNPFLLGIYTLNLLLIILLL